MLTGRKWPAIALWAHHAPARRTHVGGQFHRVGKRSRAGLQCVPWPRVWLHPAHGWVRRCQVIRPVQVRRPGGGGYLETGGSIAGKEQGESGLVMPALSVQMPFVCVLDPQLFKACVRGETTRHGVPALARRSISGPKRARIAGHRKGHRSSGG